MITCSINDVNLNLTLTEEDYNTFYVESRNEVFFDVFECKVGEEKVLLEQIDVHEKGPVVLFEVTIDNKRYSTNAILVDSDKTYLKINEDLLHAIREKSNIFEEEITEEVGDEQAVETTTNLQYINVKEDFLNDIEEQFEGKIANLKEDISDKLDIFFSKLESTKEGAIKEEIDNLSTELDGKFIELKEDLKDVEEFNKKNINNLLEKKITEVDESVSFFFEKLTEDYKDQLTGYRSEIAQTNTGVNKLEEKLTSSNKLIYDRFTNSQEGIEAKFNELFTLKSQLLDQDRLIVQNKELLEFINEEFNTINNKFLYLSEEENKKYNDLLAAVSKKDVVEYKTILKEKIQEVELTQIKEALQDEISNALRGDITALKRYVEMSSGGGSVAKQFANGGVMNGALNVTSKILSSGVDLTDIFPTNGGGSLSNYLPLTGGNLTGTLSSNSTIIADNILATNLLSATYLDIGFELSGFNVTGSISASGDISAHNLNLSGDLNVDGLVDGRNIANDGAATDKLKTDVIYLSSEIDDIDVELDYLNTDITYLSGEIDGLTLDVITDNGNITTNNVQVANLSATGKIIGNADSNIAVGSNTGILGGRSNEANGTSSVVGGGYDNVANGGYSFVGGGVGNFANTGQSAIVGGNSNTANGYGYNFIGGGGGNTTGGYKSAIVGGSYNTANGYVAFVGGGSNNSACTNHSGIASGYQNRVTGQMSFIGGGFKNCASGNNSVVGGGGGYYYFNTASGTRSAILGGGSNTASGNCSFIGGGFCNTSSGNYSVVAGGSYNTISGNNSVVAGGFYNTASGNYSVVAGGVYNIASGNNSSVAGGSYNTISDNYSVVAGGIGNRACCTFSTVGGGSSNTASGESSVVAGGGAGYYASNVASGNCSGILGGHTNTATHDDSFIIGSNLASNAACTTFVNNLSAQCNIYSNNIISNGTATVGKITLSNNSLVTETSSFTLGEEHRGATVLLQNSSPMTVTVTSQVSGHVTTFIAETSNTVTFAPGIGLSGFNSFNGANQIAGIYGQAQIIFKSPEYAFLGGNVL